MIILLRSMSLHNHIALVRIPCLKQKKNTVKVFFFCLAQGKTLAGIQCVKRYTVPFYDDSASLDELAQSYRIGPNPLPEIKKEHREGVPFFIWRRARDSNPRILVEALHDFQSCSFGQLGQPCVCIWYYILIQ